MAEPSTLCERLDAMQEALLQARDPLYQLSMLVAEGEDSKKVVRLTQELAGAGTDLTHQAAILLGALRGRFCRGE